MDNIAFARVIIWELNQGVELINYGTTEACLAYDKAIFKIS